MKLYQVYKLKRPFDGLKYVVYKREYGEILPTYYCTKKMAEGNKNFVAC